MKAALASILIILNASGGIAATFRGDLWFATLNFASVVLLWIVFGDKIKTAWKNDN